MLLSIAATTASTELEEAWTNPSADNKKSVFKPMGLKCPRFLEFPKLSMISHAHLWLLLFMKISLFIYFNLIPEPIRVKININKETNREKQKQQKVSMADHAQL